MDEQSFVLGVKGRGGVHWRGDTVTIHGYVRQESSEFDGSSLRIEKMSSTSIPQTFHPVYLPR